MDSANSHGGLLLIYLMSGISWHQQGTAVEVDITIWILHQQIKATDLFLEAQLCIIATVILKTRMARTPHDLVACNITTRVHAHKR